MYLKLEHIDYFSILIQLGIDLKLVNKYHYCSNKYHLHIENHLKYNN